MKQSLFDIRCEWGEQGIAALHVECDVIIVVDVLSFSTSVSMAVTRGAEVLPISSQESDPTTYAKTMGALLAGTRAQWVNGEAEFCLSPQSMGVVKKQQRLGIFSLNGATLSLLADATPVLIGCLRNARAVAAAAMRLGSTIGIIPAGERWPDHSLRPAWEDLIGAGAIINELDGQRSPEAAVAEMAYLSVIGEVEERMMATVSGRELVEAGFSDDIRLACEENADIVAARLVNGVFIRY